MKKHTIEINISSIINSQTDEWIYEFIETVEHAFQNSDNYSRLLGNLLVMEQYINTLRQGLAANGKTLSAGLEYARDMLWDYLNTHITPANFQDFANDYYDCLLAYNIGNVATDAPKEFYSKYFANANPDAYELLAIEWSSGLLMQLVSIAGGRIDFDDFKGYKQVDFYGVSIMFSILEDACIGLTNTPRTSDTGNYYEKAIAQVHHSPLFQGIVRHVQNCLQAALDAVPDTLESLYNEYSQYTILPKEYASALLLE